MLRTAIPFLYLVLVISGAWAQEMPPAGSDQYHVTFNTANPDRIRVKAEITISDSLLYMSPYGPMPERWPDFIRNIRASNSDGAEIVLLREADGKGWVFEEYLIGQTAVLEYDMVLEHEGQDWPGGIDGVAYVREWGIMATGRSLFVMNGKSKRRIRVSFSTPASWNVSVPWVSIDGADDTFRVEDLTELQESFIFAGTHQETEIKREDFTMKFVLGGPSVLQQQTRFAELASDIMDYYIGLMGGIPKPGPGEVMSQCLVIISQADSVDGEVIGNNISMFMDPDGPEFNQMIGWFMFAHEFFHLWNGKTLRFTSTNTDWFKEGVSNYYTMKALYQTGFASEEVILAMLNNLFYQRYTHDPGYGSLPPYKAASGFDKDKHWGLIYGGGLFVGIALDMEIRNRTQNEASLDKLMRNFYEVYGGTENTIDQDDILGEVNKLGNTDFEALLSDHILGTEPISLTPYLKYAGVNADDLDNQLKIHHIPDKSPLQKDMWNGFLGGK